MQSYLLIAAVTASVTILTYVFGAIFGLCSNCCKQKVRPAPKKWCGLFWFNGFILSVSLVFLPMCIYTAEGLKNVFLDTDALILVMRTDLSVIDWKDTNVITSFVLLAVAIAIPVIFYRVLKKYKDQLSEPSIKARIWNLYADLSMFNRHEKISYYPMFLTKRLVFVMIPAICYWGPFAQI